MFPETGQNFGAFSSQFQLFRNSIGIKNSLKKHIFPPLNSDVKKLDDQKKS